MTYLTEEQANETWCPHTRVVVVSGNESVSGNRMITSDGEIIHNHSATRCIASQCSQWRVGEAKYRDGVSGELLDRNLTDRGKWVDLGFCGLAGEPVE